MSGTGLGARLIGAARSQAITTVALSGALFIAQAGVARRFGGLGLGEYTAVSLGVYLASAVAAFALPVIVSRDVAYLEERHERGVAARHIGAGLSLLIPLGVVVGLALTVLWDHLGTGVPALELVGGPLLVCAVLASSLGGYAIGIFQARLMIPAAALVSIAQPLTVVLAIGWDTISPGVHPAQIAVAGWIALGLVGGTGLIAAQSAPNLEWRLMLSHARAALPYLPVSYANNVAGLVDRLVVSVVLGPGALGVYQAASVIVEGSLRILQGGITLFTSAYGRAAARGEEHGPRMQRVSVRLWSAYAAVVAAALIAGADGIVTIYGTFQPAIAPLQTLAAGLVPTVVAATLLTAGVGSGRRGALVIARLAIPVQMVGGAFLASAFGIQGMAFAQLAVILPVAVAQMYWSRDPDLVPTRALGLRLVLVSMSVPALGLIAQTLPLVWVIRAAAAGAAAAALSSALLLGHEERAVARLLLEVRRPRTARERA